MADHPVPLAVSLAHSLAPADPPSPPLHMICANGHGGPSFARAVEKGGAPVSYTHLRAHETSAHL
eukprot:3036248-Alexandrium_andersonii.AAC.1